MTDKAVEKPFDCVQWTRNIRNQRYEETKHMSREQRLHWL